MLCRKQIKIRATNTSIYELIVSELSKNQELSADYDIESIEIVIKKKSPPFQMRRILFKMCHFCVIHTRKKNRRNV